jgi:hypothetical protein
MEPAPGLLPAYLLVASVSRSFDRMPKAQTRHRACSTCAALKLPYPTRPSVAFPRLVAAPAGGCCTRGRAACRSPLGRLLFKTRRRIAIRVRTAHGRGKKDFRAKRLSISTFDKRRRIDSRAKKNGICGGAFDFATSRRGHLLNSETAKVARSGRRKDA